MAIQIQGTNSVNVQADSFMGVCGSRRYLVGMGTPCHP